MHFYLTSVTAKFQTSQSEMTVENAVRSLQNTVRSLQLRTVKWNKILCEVCNFAP
jgi:hypothetical protein